MENTNIENKGKIVLIKGQSQYNVLRYAIDLLAKGFEECGYQTVVIDGAGNYTIGGFAALIREEMDDRGLFIFSYNAIMHEVFLENNMGLYDFLGYPCFGLLVDHPFYHKTRLIKTKGENITIGCIDRDHVDYIHTFYPKLKKVAFVPHFSFQEKNRVEYENRTCDLYFPGSYKDPKSYQKRFDELPKVFSDIAIKMSKTLLQNAKLTLEEALKRYFKSVQFTYTPEEFLEIINNLFFVDHYVRDYRRDKIVRTILKAGIKLTVSGSGWDGLKEIYGDDLEVLGVGGLDIIDNIRSIANSKILLNIIPNYKNGTHERVFTAMMNGCVCLTDSTGYLFDNNFKDNETIVFYDVNQIDKIPSKIFELLNKPEKAKFIAENGYQKVLNEYNDKSMARRILNIMGYEL